MRKRAADDDALMEAIAEGDSDAFTILVERHRGWVRSVAYAFVHDLEQAEDLTQEVFCRVHRQAGSYDARGVFVAWLKRITINLAKDALRRQRQAALIPLGEGESEAAPMVPFDPIAALIMEGLQEEVRAAIQALPDPVRLTLIMRYFGDMNVRDIAWALQCPEGTVKSRLHYGLERVRHTLTTQWEQEEGETIE